MWVSDSYEDIYARAESSLARGDLENSYADFQRLSQRLASLKPSVLERRPELRNLRLLSLAKQGRIRHFQGQFEQALQLYEQLLEMDAANRDRWRRDMSLVRIDMGQPEAGLDELRAQAVSHSGDSSLWLTLGAECEALDRLEEAEESFQRAARLAATDDDKTEAYLALFDLYRAQSRVDEALAAWQKAWETHGHQPGYVFPLYQMMWESGDLARAEEYLRQEKNPLRKGFFQGTLAAGQGQPQEALKHWQRVTKMDPLEYEEGHEAWAEAALRSDHPPQEVLGALTAIMERDSLSPRGFILYAVAEARLGHTEHAQNVLEMARGLGLRVRPRQEKLAEAHWLLLDELVANAEIKSELRRYFEGDAVT